MSTKSHIYKRCGILRKKSFSKKGYAEIHIQRMTYEFFILKKNQNHMPWLHFYLFLKNMKISNFGGILKFLKLIVFGQILAVLGRYCSIHSG